MKAWHALIAANEPADFALALGVAAAILLAALLARRLAAALLDGTPRELARASRLALLAPLAALGGAAALELPPRLEHVAEMAALVGLVAQAAVWFDRLLQRWLERRFRASRAHDPAEATTLNLIGFVARAALWAIAALLALDQLGFDVTALVAGLGIGGVALALAVQSVLADLFACAAIALDKPFVVGDFIVVDSLRGTVENVGLKTTRVRSLDGELLIFANADLLKSRVRNFRRMQERRIQFSIGVTYGTPAEKLRRIPRIVREAVEAQPDIRFERAHFKEYGDWALVFEVVYHLLTPDYNAYMDMQQTLNLALYERFAQERIEFAQPASRVFLQPAPLREAAVERLRA